jgi:hypothetical protein
MRTRVEKFVINRTNYNLSGMPSFAKEGGLPKARRVIFFVDSFSHYNNSAILTFCQEKITRHFVTPSFAKEGFFPTNRNLLSFSTRDSHK